MVLMNVLFTVDCFLGKFDKLIFLMLVTTYKDLWSVGSGGE